MLADQDRPLEDAIAESAAGATPDPKLVVVYRTRGVPWLLIPPLLLLAGVAAIVVYRRSADGDRRPSPGWRDAGTARKSPAASAPAADARVHIDALTELTAATGRPASAITLAKEEPRYVPAPLPIETAPSKPVASREPKPAPAVTPPVPSPVVAAAVKKPVAAAPKPVVTEPKPVVTEPKPPAPEPKLATPPSSAPPVGAKPVSADVFDPIVASPRAATVRPFEPPPAPAAPPVKHDRVGFDPEAKPATLESEPKPAPDPPAATAAASPTQPPAPASPTQPPAPERPFELDRKPAQGLTGGGGARRAERNREIEADMQAEGERKLAERARLMAIKEHQANLNPQELMVQREEFMLRVRIIAAQDRRPFHDELKRLINEQGRAAGPDIKALRDRFGVDTLPEIMERANRDLTQIASRLSDEQRIQRMRRWGLPETMILDDLRERQLLNVKARGGPQSEEEAWVFAAWHLLHYPPATAKPNAQPAAPAAGR